MVNPKRLYQGTLGATVADLYTVGSGKTAIVKDVMVCNYTGGAVTFTLHLVPTGGSVADGNKLFSAQSLSAGETKTFRFSLALSAGDKLSGLASAGSSINVFVSGVEIS